MKSAIFSICFFVSIPVTFAQRVTSESYDNMLQSLLSHTVQEISVADAAQLKNAAFIDARELNEYNVSHLKNAWWSGYDDFNAARLNGVSKELTLIVYCSVGYRSEKIAEKLIAAGYKNTHNLYGGIFEWKNQGHPVYDTNGNETEKVHAYSKSWGSWLTKGIRVYDN